MSAEEFKRSMVITGSVKLFVIGILVAAYLSESLDPSLRLAEGGDGSRGMSVASFTAPKPQFVDFLEDLVNLNTT